MSGWRHQQSGACSDQARGVLRWWGLASHTMLGAAAVACLTRRMQGARQPITCGSRSWCCSVGHRITSLLRLSASTCLSLAALCEASSNARLALLHWCLACLHVSGCLLSLCIASPSLIRSVFALENTYTTLLDFGGINTSDAEAAIKRASKGGMVSAKQLRGLVTLLDGEQVV